MSSFSVFSERDLYLYPWEQFSVGNAHETIVSYTYRKNGVTPGLDILIQGGASLKYIPCGDIVERAARSKDYKIRLSWLTGHGASYREVRGGINRLCRESYDRSDFEKFRWLFKNGASLDILAETVSKVPNRSGPRTVHALLFHRDRLMKVLRAGEIPGASNNFPLERQSWVQQHWIWHIKLFHFDQAHTRQKDIVPSCVYFIERHNHHG